MTHAVLLLLLLGAPAYAYLIPGHVAGDVGATLSGANTLFCYKWTAPETATLTQLAVRVTSGGGSSRVVGAALYPDSNGGTALGALSVTTTTGAQTATATGLTIAIVAGTQYRACVCVSSTSLILQSMNEATGAGKVAALLNGGGFSTTVGTGANSCTAGVTPSTTGALTADTSFKLPLLLLE